MSRPLIGSASPIWNTPAVTSGQNTSSPAAPVFALLQHNAAFPSEPGIKPAVNIRCISMSAMLMLQPLQWKNSLCFDFKARRKHLRSDLQAAAGRRRYLNICSRKAMSGQICVSISACDDHFWVVSPKMSHCRINLRTKLIVEAKFCEGSLFSEQRCFFLQSRPFPDVCE